MKLTTAVVFRSRARRSPRSRVRNARRRARKFLQFYYTITPPGTYIYKKKRETKGEGIREKDGKMKELPQGAIAEPNWETMYYTEEQRTKHTHARARAHTELAVVKASYLAR